MPGKPQRSIGSIKPLGDNKYLLRVSAGFDDYGRRIQRSKTITATSERAAEDALIQFYNETRKAAKERTADAPKTLAALYEEFKKNHLPSLRLNTQGFYESLWETHLKQYGKSRLKTFSPKMIYGILNDCQSGDRTRKAIYGFLRTMFTQAVTWGYMSDNPCLKVKAPKYKAQEKVIYDKEQLALALSYIDSEDLAPRTMFYLAILCGLRRGEIMGLRWEDIDFDAKEVLIRKAAAIAPKVGTYHDDPKTKKSVRKLALPETLIPILKGLRAEQGIQRFRLAERWNDTPWVFKNWSGEALNLNAPTRWWQRFREAHPDLPEMSFHGLRHMAATLLIQQNVPITTVSGILGHAQIGTTVNTYSHVIEDTKKGALESLESSVMGVKSKSVK